MILTALVCSFSDCDNGVLCSRVLGKDIQMRSKHLSKALMLI